MHFNDLDVIILTYNRAQYLGTALEAICNSNATWRKTIIIDNASTDNTSEVIADIKKRYPSRKIVHIRNKENIGNLGNFKKSQLIADNKYVAVFHDDDAIHPEYIDRAMGLLEKNPRAIMCSGGVHGLYCVANYNWDFLPDSYFIYPPEFNAFLQLIVGRPTFCCNIYKTSVYKKVQYHPEKYGKLHDICFMFDVGQYGDLIFLHGECVRWRQHVSSDSNSLKTGPFPNEVVNIIAHIQEVYLHERPVKGLREHIRYTFVKTLIFNFSYFLYNWSDLKRYLTWDQMKDELIKQNVFSTKDYRTYDRIIDVFLNPTIRKLSKYYMHKYSRPYSYRVENL